VECLNRSSHADASADRQKITLGVGLTLGGIALIVILFYLLKCLRQRSKHRVPRAPKPKKPSKAAKGAKPSHPGGSITSRVPFAPHSRLGDPPNHEHRPGHDEHDLFMHGGAGNAPSWQTQTHSVSEDPLVTKKKEPQKPKDTKSRGGFLGRKKTSQTLEPATRLGATSRRMPNQRGDIT